MPSCSVVGITNSSGYCGLAPGQQTGTSQHGEKGLIHSQRITTGGQKSACIFILSFSCFQEALNRLIRGMHGISL